MRRQFKIPTSAVIETIRAERGTDIPEAVINAIESERDYQESRWNPDTTTTEGLHTFSEWCVYIEDYIQEGLGQARSNATATAAATMRKVVSMAVAALEQYGVPQVTDLKFSLSLDQGRQTLEWWFDTLQSIVNICKHTLSREAAQVSDPKAAVQFVRLASYGVAAMEQHGAYQRIGFER